MARDGGVFDLKLVKEEPPVEEWVNVKVDIEEHELLQLPRVRDFEFVKKEPLDEQGIKVEVEIDNGLQAPKEFQLFDDDIKEQLQASEASIGQNIGSEVDDEEVLDLGISMRVRNVSEFPARLDDVPDDLIPQLAELDRREDRALLGMVTKEMLDFQWSSDADIFKGKREEFTGVAGPTFETDNLTPLSIFQKIWDEDILNTIVRETNRYAQDHLASHNLSPHSRLRRWREMTRDELWTYFALNIFMSLIPLAVEKHYWFPSQPYLKVGNMSLFMSYERFILIKKYLHFVNNKIISEEPSVDKKIQKIQPILDHLNLKFQTLYNPEQEIAIDESLLLWKGRLSFSQLIATKAAGVGIKSYELCESRTGYLWKIIIYTGKKDTSQDTNQDKAQDIALDTAQDIALDTDTTDNEPTGATTKIVMDLVWSLLGKGHTLVMDNFYNSPLLSRMLKAQKTDTMGTLRLNRQFLPESLRQKTKHNMRTGEVAFSQTRDLTVAVWKDASLVSLISTFHNLEVGGKEKHGSYKYKPNIVLDYNLSMGGVDKKDQLLSAYQVERSRNHVWYKKLFRRLLNVSIHNAYIIFRHKHEIGHRDFRTLLMDQIVKQNTLPAPRAPLVPPRTGHFPQKVTKGKPRCKYCAANKISSRTQWTCDTCNVSLCIIGCFKNYHLQQASLADR